MKNKKPLFITLLALDLAVTIFFLVLSIIVLASFAKDPDATQKAGGLIGFFANNPLAYGLCCVVPSFLLLVGNIIGLVVYVRKTTKREPVKVNDLTDEQKEALRQELLKELQNK